MLVRLRKLGDWAFVAGDFVGSEVGRRGGLHLGEDVL